MPPKAEENGVHAQEREANCSMQHAKSENAAQMLIAAGGHTVVYETQGKIYIYFLSQIFIIREKKSSFGNLCSNVDFLIITKNSGGLAAMQTPSSANAPSCSGSSWLEEEEQEKTVRSDSQCLDYFLSLCVCLSLPVCLSGLLTLCVSVHVLSG